MNLLLLLIIYIRIAKILFFDKKAFESETDVSKIEWELMDKYGHEFYINNLGKICPLKNKHQIYVQPPK